MEGLTGLAPLAGTSLASPRWPSARLWSPRPTQRETTSRPHSGHSVIAAASGPQQYCSVALPSSFRASGCRQPAVATAMVAEQQPASWSMRSGGRTLIHTNPMELSLEVLVRDPIAWLLRLISRLQSMLAQLFSGSQKRGSMPSCISSPRESASAVSDSTSAVAAGTATRRCSSGRYVPTSASKGRCSNVAAATTTPTQLIATQTPPVTCGQGPALPLAALALATAAALGCGGVYMYKRWQVTMAGKRETEQRMAVKKDSLARQKQRFQRALVVDSVNLELPPIKDMDVQPGPVQVEKIISQQGSPGQSRPSNPPRASQVPGLAGDSLRQWQQFMAASKAKEVTNLSGSPRGGRGAEPPAEEQRPYLALDDRMLADLSERIRKANELTAAGGAAPPMPVITFEELYANNTESDDEAMARRAAERKARWQKQHPGAGGAAPRSAGPRGPRAEKPATAVGPTPPSASASPSPRGASVDSVLGGTAGNRDASSVSAASTTTSPAGTDARASRLAAAEKPGDIAAAAGAGPRSASSRFTAATAAPEMTEGGARASRHPSSRARAADWSDTTGTTPSASPRGSSSNKNITSSSGGGQRAAGDGKEEVSVAYNLQEARAKVLNANNPFAVGLFSGPSSDTDPDAPVSTSTTQDSSNRNRPTRTSSVMRQEQQPSPQATPSRPEPSSPRGASGFASSSGRLSEAGPTSASTLARHPETMPSSVSVSSRDGEGAGAVPAAPRSPGRDSVVQEPGKSGSPGHASKPSGASALEANTQASAADDGPAKSRGVLESDAMHDAAGKKGTSPSAAAFGPAIDADVAVSLQSPEELAAAANRVKRVPSAGQLRKPDTHEPGLARLMRRPTAAAGLQDKGRGGSKANGQLAEL